MNKMFKHLNSAVKIVVLFFVIMVIQTGSNIQETKVENNNLNMTLDLTAMSKKVQEDIYNDIYSAKDTYIGDLTGYAADCALCTGYLSCNNQDVRNGVINYYDNTYGNVRIVASSTNLACGTIIKLNTNRLGENEQLAIVLDRGVLGKDIDLLMPSETDAKNAIGRSSIAYDILRFGWER